MPKWEFLERHDSEELSELLAYDILSPIGTARTDIHNQLLAYASGKGKFADWKLDFAKEPEKPLTGEAAKEVLRGISNVHNRKS